MAGSLDQVVQDREIHDVSAADNDYLKVIADARLKLEKINSPQRSWGQGLKGAGHQLPLWRAAWPPNQVKTANSRTPLWLYIQSSGNIGRHSHAADLGTCAAHALRPSAPRHMLHHQELSPTRHGTWLWPRLYAFLQAHAAIWPEKHRRRC